MDRGAMRAKRAPVLACCIAFALSGCSGGSAVVRSNFSGGGGAVVSLSSPSAPPVSAPQQGLTGHYSGSGNVGLALLGIVIVADLVQWSALQLKQAFGWEASPQAAAAYPQRIVSTPRKCVYPVPEMCRATLIPERQVDTDAAAARSIQHVTSGVDVLHGHAVGLE